MIVARSIIRAMSGWCGENVPESRDDLAAAEQAWLERHQSNLRLADVFKEKADATDQKLLAGYAELTVSPGMRKIQQLPKDEQKLWCKAHASRRIASDQVWPFDSEEVREALTLHRGFPPYVPPIINLDGVTADGFHIFISGRALSNGRTSGTMVVEFSGWGYRGSAFTDIEAACQVTLRKSVDCTAPSQKSSPYLSGASFAYQPSNSAGEMSHYICTSGCGGLVPAAFTERPHPTLPAAPPPPAPTDGR
jgi:hypothetical protein